MKRIKKWFSDNLPWLIVLGVGAICFFFIVFGYTAEDGSITLDGNNAKIEQYTEDFKEEARKALESTIIYADEEVPAKIVTADGEETVDIPTVESVEGVAIPNEEETNEDGRGAYHNTTTYLDYYNSVGENACINNGFGAQCFALANDFWQNYAGRSLSSCNTGAAKGILNCYPENAGDEFVMVWDAHKLQPGDWLVFSSGQYGHIGMAMGYYNNGYIALYGQNQGGSYCPRGGAGTNIINISLRDFIGAFRPKTYILPEPGPEPTPSANTCEIWHVSKGDTMSAIMKACQGAVNWNLMDSYANDWISDRTGKSVFYGWNHGTHYGLLAGDTIRYIGD